MTELEKAALEALEFCEFCWRDVAMNDYALEKLEQTTAALTKALATTEPGEQTEREAWVPYLVDRADGVKGHYAIGRWNPRGYREVWNLHSHRWAAYSDDVMSLEEADSLLRQITIPTVRASLPATTERKGEPPELVPREWRQALRKLAFMARTSGGTSGPDAGLQAALQEAEELLTKPYNHTSPQVPEGFALVPVGPTPEMIRCAEMWDDGFEGAYARALDAARKGEKS